MALQSRQTLIQEHQPSAQAVPRRAHGLGKAALTAKRNSWRILKKSSAVTLPPAWVGSQKSDTTCTPQPQRLWTSVSETDQWLHGHVVDFHKCQAKLKHLLLLFLLLFFLAYLWLSGRLELPLPKINYVYFFTWSLVLVRMDQKGNLTSEGECIFISGETPTLLLLAWYDPV